MAGVTIRFGVILIVLGAVFFIMTGHSAPTSLIPAFFGIVLILFGILARTEDSRKRMLWMHIAVTVGLVGFLIPAIRVVMAYMHPPILRPMAVREEELMAVILIIYVLLCVRSFIAARRARLA